MGLKISPSASVSLRPEAKLTASLTNVATGAVLSITAGKGALFPTYGGGDFSYLTLYDAAGNVEVIKVTARSTDTLTIDAAGRGLDNTNARAWNIGDGVRLGLPPITLLELARNPVWCGTAGGSADAITLTTAFPATAYAAGLPIEFIVASANTGAVTVNVNALGAKSLVLSDLAALTAGMLPIGMIVRAVYDGTRFIVADLGRISIASISTLTPAADRLPYYTSATAAALATLTSFARTSLLAAADGPAVFTALVTKGADIASAATTDLGAVAGFYHDITGSVTITSFGTVAAGVIKRLKFEGALTLTNNANIICPGGANIPIQIGDCIDTISEGSGVWRVTNFEPAVRVAGMVLLETKIASASASLDFSNISTDYDCYEFRFESIRPASGGGTFRVRYNGSSSAIYTYTRIDIITASVTATGTGAVTDTANVMTGAVPASATRTIAGTMRLNRLDGQSDWVVGYNESTGGFDPKTSTGTGGIPGSGAVSSVSFSMSTSNITSGTIRMYGMRK